MKDYESEMEGIFMSLNNSIALKMNPKYKRILYFLILRFEQFALKKNLSNHLHCQNPTSP